MSRHSTRFSLWHCVVSPPFCLLRRTLNSPRSCSRFYLLPQFETNHQGLLQVTISTFNYFLITQVYEILIIEDYLSAERVKACQDRDLLPVPAYWYCIGDINNFLIVLNSSMNCLIYCLVGRRFRFTLKRMLHKVYSFCNI